MHRYNALIVLATLGASHAFVPSIPASSSLSSPFTRARITSVKPMLASQQSNRRKSSIRLAQREDASEVISSGASKPDLVQYFVLLSVPLVWGTYAPAVRYLYEMEVPLPGIFFSALYYVVALTTLLVVRAAFAPSADTVEADNISSAASEGSDRSLWSCGAELGGYLYLGNLFQVLGLQWTTADRAAFLVQLTTLLVPVLEATLFAGQPGVKPLTPNAWAACAVAALGVVIISADGAGVDFVALASSVLHPSSAAAAAAALPTDSTGLAVAAATDAAASSPVSSDLALSLRGDALVACSAIAYSFHVLRLGNIAPRTQPLDLAVAKAAAETAYSAVTLVFLLGIAPSLTNALGLGSDWLPGHFPPAADLNAFRESAASGAVGSSEWSAIAGASLWCGAFTCAYTIWAQSFGQRAVRPTSANLIYTSQPIFSAGFAAVLLGEKLSPQGACGGAITIAALVLSLQADPGIEEGNVE